MNVPDVPEELFSKIKNGECGAFVGAGLSAAAGLPTWKQLLADLLEAHLQTGVDANDREALNNLLTSERLLELAEYLRGQTRPRVFRDVLSRLLNRSGIEPSEAHKVLISIPFSVIVTTNFDHLLEDSYSAILGPQHGRAYKYDNLSALASLLGEKRPFILKAHGSVDDTDTMIFSRSDYQHVMFGSPAYRTFFTSLLSSRTFLFLGYSLNDPDFMMVLEDLATVFKGYGAVHYALVPDPGYIERKLAEQRFNMHLIPYGPSTSTHREVQSFLAQIAQRLADEDAAKRREEQERIWRVIHQQKMEAIGTLVSGIFHDLNNVLTSIFGYGELIARETLPDDPRGRWVAGLLNSARSAARLIHQVSEFARSSTLDQEQEAIPLHVEVENVLSLVSLPAYQHIRIEKDVEYDCFVRGNPNELEQLAMNLVLNSFEAMPSGGTLRIMLKRVSLSHRTSGVVQELPPGEYVLLEIQDSGCGIPEDVRLKVFDPYVTTKANATGLGLSIVYGVAKRHGGDIEFETTKGKGTTFRVYFPPSKGSTECPKVTIPPISLRGRGERIVVVDDEPGFTYPTVEVLTALGYECNGFLSGKEAMEYLRGHHAEVDLLIVDVILPDVAGSEVVRLMKDMRPDCRVLVVSGLPIDSWQSDLRGEEIARLEKPCEPKDVAATVAELLRMHPGKRTAKGSERRSKEEKRLKLLFADDDDVIRLLLQQVLEGDQRLELLFAPDGEEAIKIAREEKPDVIFLDVLMPGKSGMDVCRELKREPATANTKILMLTAVAGEQNRQEAADAGADDYFIKPFSPLAIVQKIEELFQMKAAESLNRQYQE